MLNELASVRKSRCTRGAPVVFFARTLQKIQIQVVNSDLESFRVI